MSHHSFPVLILGESGTGKELVARSIHALGPRSGGPFVPVDCSALVPTLIESELFGHVRGAFTGADRSKQGLVEAAHGGTLFLDEIGNLPLEHQAKLLRALQEKEIRRAGATERVATDVRVVAATNQDLESAIQKGGFRRDLYFRLNVVEIVLPPLRERRQDIPLLAYHFMERYAAEFGGTSEERAISREAMTRLIAYHWPGNIRELENAIQHGLAMGSGAVLQLDDLPPSMHCASTDPMPSTSGLVPLEELERRAILRALEETGGDKLAAARLLEIGKTTLYRKLKEYRRKAAAD